MDENCNKAPALQLLGSCAIWGKLDGLEWVEVLPFASFASHVQLMLIGVNSLPSDSTASALPSVPTISYRRTRHLSRPGHGSPKRSVSGSFRDM